MSANAPQTILNELLRIERIFNRIIYPFKHVLIPFQITTNFTEYIISNIHIDTGLTHTLSGQILIQTKKFLELNIRRTLRNLMYDAKSNLSDLNSEGTFQEIYPTLVKSLFKNILTDWEIKNLILTSTPKIIADTTIPTYISTELLFKTLQNYKVLHDIAPLVHLNLFCTIGRQKDKYPVLPYVTSAIYLVKLTSAIYDVDTSLSLFFVSTFIQTLQHFKTPKSDNPLLKFLRKLNHQLTYSFNKLQDIYNLSLTIENLDDTNQKIIRIVYRNNKISKNNLQRKLKISGPTAYRRTTTLKRLGLLEIISANKETYYKLSPRVKYYLWLRKDYVSTLLEKKDIRQQ